MQTLLNESSIKIYLYLGAFFVIASALILAAVVEAARLPILAAATLGFGGAAFVIRKRLPQPSFALFIVFSFLLAFGGFKLSATIGDRRAFPGYWDTERSRRVPCVTRSIRAGPDRPSSSRCTDAGGDASGLQSVPV